MADFLCPYCHAIYRDAQGHCPSDGSLLIEVPQVNDLSGQVLRRKYRLDCSLGQGGFGSVYQATHLVLGKTVAVKVLRSEFRQDATMVARFFNEARVVTRLANPHTIQTFDLDQTEEGLLFMVMEFVSGRTLRSLAVEEGSPSGRLAWERALAILIQVCESLEEAHGQSVIHRDLKPDNIMVSDKGGSKDFATVLDFGIAKVLEGTNAGLTAAGSLIGSPAYMSPEQILGRPLDARSDLYSLGAVAYQILSGTLPVNARQTAAILQEKVLVPPTPMRTKLPGLSLPEELDHLVVSLLATAPENRPGSAVKVKEALVSLLTGWPGSALVGKPVLATPHQPLEPQAGHAATVGYAEGRLPVSPGSGASIDSDGTVALGTAPGKIGEAHSPHQGSSPAGRPAGVVLNALGTSDAEHALQGSALLETLQAPMQTVAVVPGRKERTMRPWMWGVAAAGILAVAVALIWAFSSPSGGASSEVGAPGHSSGPVAHQPKEKEHTAQGHEQHAIDAGNDSAMEPARRVPETHVSVKPPEEEEPLLQPAAPAGPPQTPAPPALPPPPQPLPTSTSGNPAPSAPSTHAESPEPPKTAPKANVPSGKSAPALPPLPIPAPDSPPSDSGRKPGDAEPTVDPVPAEVKPGGTSPAKSGVVVTDKPVSPPSPADGSEEVPDKPAEKPVEKKPETKRKSPAWGTPDMDDLEREMKEELRKSMEMWQDPEQ